MSPLTTAAPVVLGGHTSDSESNAASEGCHLIAQLHWQVIMSDLQTSMPVGDGILRLGLGVQMIVCLRHGDDNLGASAG